MSAEPEPVSHYKRIKHFNLPNQAHFLTFSCFQRKPFLLNEPYRKWLGEAVRSNCDKHSLALWAYVFMPEHVHLLLYPKQSEYDVAAWLKSIKNSVAKRVLNQLRREDSPAILEMETGERVSHRFWQAGPGYDKNIWSTQVAIEKAEYCHWNPVKRGLVNDPNKWKWSSFRWLEGGRREAEPLHVDDWTEC